MSESFTCPWSVFTNIIILHGEKVYLTWPTLGQTGLRLPSRVGQIHPRSGSSSQPLLRAQIEIITDSPPHGWVGVTNESSPEGKLARVGPHWIGRAIQWTWSTLTRRAATSTYHTPTTHLQILPHTVRYGKSTRAFIFLSSRALSFHHHHHWLEHRTKHQRDCSVKPFLADGFSFCFFGARKSGL